MPTLNLNDTKPSSFAWLNLGFRPFFLGAGVFAIASIFLWLLVYTTGFELSTGSLTAYQWHSHEMIFGYGVAVIAGFVLTAAKNWTGIQTTTGIRLLLLFSGWAIARVALASGLLPLAAVADLGFMLSLCIALGLPIIQRKQWGQLPVLGIVVLLLAANTVFYAGAFAWIEGGAHLGIYGGIYLIMGIILVMGRRVVPFFIERGVDGEAQLRNNSSLDIAILVLFVLFAITSLMPDQINIARAAALLLFIATAVRNVGWHSKLLWQKPLLWSLYVAFWFFSLGFLLYFAAPLFGYSPFLAVHAFGYGGIGVITLSMMARVALGHTGRNVQEPPAIVKIFLLILLAGAVVRIGLPLLMPAHYTTWIILSQVLWIAAFVAFSVQYAPYLCKPRTDGNPG